MMVDYYPLSYNHKLPEPDPEPEEEQEIQEPVADIDVVWNVYQEKGDAKSFALKLSLRLPLKS
jgi:hypothetical protein